LGQKKMLETSGNLTLRLSVLRYTQMLFLTGQTILA
jgi:hypothetical protein